MPNARGYRPIIVYMSACSVIALIITSIPSPSSTVFKEIVTRLILSTSSYWPFPSSSANKFCSAVWCLSVISSAVSLVNCEGIVIWLRLLGKESILGCSRLLTEPDIFILAPFMGVKLLLLPPGPTPNPMMEESPPTLLSPSKEALGS